MRKTVKDDVPEEWKRRVKAGLCPVCAKTPVEFDKGQRVFCSIKCREKYASKYTWWSELRRKILEKYNETCAKCGTNYDKFKKHKERKYKKNIKKWIKENKELIETHRNDYLVHLDRRYRQEYEETMDDIKIAGKIISWEERGKLEGRRFSISFEVDHVVPVALGGDMWNEKNLQVLCIDCHKEKTAKDRKKIAEYNRKESK